MREDWRYIFSLFYRHSPGFIELYQENCRIYLDEYEPNGDTEKYFHWLHKRCYVYRIHKKHEDAMEIEEILKTINKIYGEPYYKKVKLHKYQKDFLKNIEKYILSGLGIPKEFIDER